MAFGSLGTIWAEIGVDIKKLDAGLMQANVKLATADRTVTSFGQKLTASSTKMMVAGGLMVGAVAAVGITSVKMAAQFETSMRNVNSISKLSETQFKALGQSVIDMSKEFPQTAKELADGLYDIASSGFVGAEGLKVLDASAKAASAGMTTTAVSAKGIVAVLNAYGYEAERAAEVSDIMFKTVDKGVITFEELSSTVGDWIGMGKAAGLEFNELSGAIAYMTTKGISAAEAGTSMQRMLVGIIKPSEDMAAVIKNAGFESGEMMLKTLGLTDTMKILNDATGGSITKLIDLIPQIRGVRGANALLGAGYEELTDYMKNFKDTTGATAIALEEQSKALNFQLQILKNNASVIAITLGNKYIPAITSTTKKLSEWISENEDATVTIINLGMAVVGSIGGLLLLAGTIGKVRGAMLLLRGTMLGSVSAYTAVAAAILGIGYAGDKVASKIDNYYLASLVRVVWQHSEVIHTGKSMIEVIKGLQDNTLTWSEYIRMNGREVDEWAQKHREGIEAIEDFNEVLDDAERFVKNYGDELPIASAAMIDLIQNYQDGTLSVEAFKIGVDELREATKNGRFDIEKASGVVSDFADKQDIARRKVDAHTKAQKEAEQPIDDTTGAIEDQEKAVDKLADEYETLLSHLFTYFNLNQNIVEATWDLEEALEEYDKVMKDSSSTDKDKQKALFGVQDRFEILTNITIPDLLSKQGDLSESEINHLKDMQNMIDKAIELGIIERGEWDSISSTIDEKINQSIIPDYVLMAGALGVYVKEQKEDLGELDESLETTTGKVKSLKDWIDKLSSKKITITTTFKQARVAAMGPGAMGGIVGHGVGYDTGGIVDMPNIPQAAGGMNIPQTGRAIPIIAHEYEVIANTSQQKNVADWYWNFINNPPEIKGSNMPIEIRIPIELNGQIIGEHVAKFIYDGVQTKQIGMGIK